MSPPIRLEHKPHMTPPGPLRVRSHNIQYPQAPFADCSNCHIPRRQALHRILHMEDSPRRNQTWAVILSWDLGGTWQRRGASLERLLQGV